MADTSRRPVTQDHSLPPVEPPSAAFLVQLFLVPGLIVAIIVCVWLAFHWLAHLGNDPEAYVRTLRRNNEGRWQAALNLANDLRGPGGRRLKEDTRLAGQLADVLADEMASGRTRGSGHSAEQSRTLTAYLCRALGEFSIPQAAPPLIARAADRSDPETARAAVEALAVLAANLKAAGGRFDDPEAVTAALLAAAAGDDDRLRSAAAFTLGVVGGGKAEARLHELVGDARENVRFNAAIGLARQGRDTAYETLAEMLALPDPQGAADDDQVQAERYKRALVVVNALKAVGRLVESTKQPPPERIVALVRALEKDAVGDVRNAAAALEGMIGRTAGNQRS